MLRVLVSFALGYWAHSLVWQYGSWSGAAAAVVSKVKSLLGR